MSGQNKIQYHSVHLPRLSEGKVERWTDGKSVALVHDLLSQRLPSEYRTCDVLYADLPWQAGFAAYNKRAGVDDGRTYRDLMTKVSGMVLRETRPVVLVTGTHALKHLPKPAQQAPVRMPVASRQPALALIYGMELDPAWAGVAGLVDHLARRFGRVGDFCCGYGWSARAFARRGKTFVVSDYNPECIGYIAAHAAEWEAAQ
jgi:hypothetical protein